ncbi:MAG: hypothetical protein ABEI99_03700 [Halobaculum sp.]
MSLQRTPGDVLVVNRGGRIVLAVSVLLLVYGVVFLGNILLAAFAAIQLLGGYLLLVILFRVVGTLERAVDAYERRVELLAENSADETVHSATEEPDCSTET